MLRGLHIEMCTLKCPGNWLEESGWTNVLVQADIASTVVADSFIKGSHVGRTRHAHQVTVNALHILPNKAYKDYTDTLLDYELPKS